MLEADFKGTLTGLAPLGEPSTAFRPWQNLPKNPLRAHPGLPPAPPQPPNAPTAAPGHSGKTCSSARPRIGHDPMEIMSGHDPMGIRTVRARSPRNADLREPCLEWTCPFPLTR